MIDEELTGHLIKSFYKVYNTLGYGFIESVYHNAMIVEIARNGLSLEVKKPIAVYYDANVIGKFEADLWWRNGLLLS
jgi:GxxExxY protein